jgi:hypothetical protein
MEMRRLYVIDREHEIAALNPALNQRSARESVQRATSVPREAASYPSKQAAT